MGGRDLKIAGTLGPPSTLAMSLLLDVLRVRRSAGDGLRDVLPLKLGSSHAAPSEAWTDDWNCFRLEEVPLIRIMLERLRFTRSRGRMLFYLLTIVPRIPGSHDSEVMTLHECIIMSRS